MLVIALVVVLLLASGGAIVGSLVITQRSRREFEQRVNQMVSGGTAAGQRRTLRSSDPAWITALEGRMRWVFEFGLTRRWGSQIPSFQLILVAVLAGSTIWSITRVAVQLPFWLSLPLTFTGFLLAPRILLAIQQSRTEKKFIALFPDALDMCVRMLRAGLPVSAAIRTIGTEGPPPINQVFTVIADRVEIGIPLEEALRMTGKELGLDEFRFFAAVVALQRRQSRADPGAAGRHDAQAPRHAAQGAGHDLRGARLRLHPGLDALHDHHRAARAEPRLSAAAVHRPARAHRARHRRRQPRARVLHHAQARAQRDGGLR
jgi:Flp pilus assembly protein TadB